MSPKLGPKAADLNMEEHVIITQILNLFYLDNRSFKTCNRVKRLLNLFLII